MAKQGQAVEQGPLGDSPSRAGELTPIQAKRRAQRLALEGQADALMAQVKREVFAFRPLGIMSELGALLGAQPKRGILIDTPCGCIVFARRRKPTPKQVQEWRDTQGKACSLREQTSHFFSYLSDVRPNTCIGNRYAMEREQYLDGLGLLDSREQATLGSLRDFWRDHPDADTGFWQSDGSIRPHKKTNFGRGGQSDARQG